MIKEIKVHVEKRTSKSGKDYYVLVDSYGNFLTFDLRIILKYFTIDEISSVEKK